MSGSELMNRSSGPNSMAECIRPESYLILLNPSSIVHFLHPLYLILSTFDTLRMTEIQDYTKAMEILAEYPTRDGLHVDSLLDSDSHGALTYNDFLILPGSISKRAPRIN